MTASAVSVAFELRSALAIVDRSAAENYVIRAPGPLGRAKALPCLFAAEQTRPARLEGLLHVHVGSGQLAPTLQDLGVDAMGVEEPLSQAQNLKPAYGVLETAIGGLVLTPLVVDATKPQVRFGHHGAVLQALGELQGRPRQLVRTICFSLIHRQLALAEEDSASSKLEVGLVAQLERPIEVAVGAGKIMPPHQEEGEVVFGPSKEGAVAQHLEEGDRSHREAGGGLTCAVVRSAQLAVDARHMPQVEDGAADRDRLFVSRDRLVTVALRGVGRGAAAEGG